MIDEKEYNFALSLKTVRESRGLTQRSLGELMGIEAGRISNWEMGIAKPTLDMFRDLCIALNCPPGILIGLSHSRLSEEEYNLLKRFRNLDDAGKHTLEAVLDSQMLRLDAQ